MSFHIVANFDEETRWLGAPPLTRRALYTVSAYAPLLAALTTSEDVTVWAPAAVEPERLSRFGDWQPPTMRVGMPQPTDLPAPRGFGLLWADPGAKAVNDRRFALRLASALGTALPGARVIHSIAQLEDHLAAGGAAASPNRAWVCKAPWSSAGRERAFGVGTSLTHDVRTQVARLLRHAEGQVVFEPWLPRICDAAICGFVGDRIAMEEPHGLLSTPRGGFAGIDLTSSGLEPSERDTLVACGKRVAQALAREGYCGPVGIDGFVYSDGGERRLQPLCEINARYTFGHVARALGQRLGIATLRFATSIPSGAQVLIRPSRGDAACVWATYA